MESTHALQSHQRTFCYLAAMVIVFLPGCSRSGGSPPPKTDKNVMCEVIIENPRLKGKHSFVTRHADGSEQSGPTPTGAPGEVEEYDYGVQVIRFCRLESGDIKVPRIIVERPHYGSFGQVTTSPVEDDPLQTLSSAKGSLLAIPIRADTKTVILLIRALDEETGWRYFEFNADDCEKSKKLRVPDLLTLPPLELPRQQSMWDAYERAAKAYESGR